VKCTEVTGLSGSNIRCKTRPPAVDTAARSPTATSWSIDGIGGLSAARFSWPRSGPAGMRTTVAGVAVNSTRPASVNKMIPVSPATARRWSPEIFVTSPINVVTPSPGGRAAVTVQAILPAPWLAITSIKTGNTGSAAEPGANFAKKRPSGAVKTRIPLTLTVAPGEVVPEIVIESVQSNGLSGVS